MKIGVIGAGAISDIYLKNMINRFDNLEVAAIANRHIEKAQAKAEQYGIPAVSVDELLADPSIEMVVNLTPVEAHGQIIRRALEAGKHVYTEKTITNNSKEAEELLALAQEKGLYLGSAPDTFLGSALQAGKEAIDAGLIGTIHSFAISANRCYDLLLSIFPFLRTPGTGILLDYGVYYLTALVSLLGPVEKVTGVTGTPYRTRTGMIPGMPEFMQPFDSPNESEVSAILQLKSGVTGTLHIDAESISADQAFFAIYGTKGILYLSDPNAFGGEVKYMPNALDPRVPAKPVTLWKFTPYEEDSRGIGPSEMAQAIEEGRPCRASGVMAHHVLEALEGILKSSEEGRPVSIASFCEIPAPLGQKAVPVVNIGHVNFMVRDEEKMVRFYTKILGMQDLFRRTTDDLLAFIEEQNGPMLTDEIRAQLRMQFPPGQGWIRYLKLSEGQFLEFSCSLGGELKDIENRSEYYGYQKVNYEVDDIDEMFRYVTQAAKREQIELNIKEGVHTTADNAREFALIDPEGNEIQFTEYGQSPVTAAGRAPKAEDAAKRICPLKYTTQVAYQVHDDINMENFYCKGLGLKKVYTLYFAQLAEYLKNAGMLDEQSAAGLMMIGNQPFVDYIEAGAHQYIELFHVPAGEKNTVQNLPEYAGFQHICLEVSDIQAAWDAVTANGIKPDSQIALGVDGSMQFWLTDPDGNRLELMEYIDGAMQRM